MRKNDYGGLFIAFDGPNGVGKSTLIEHTKTILARNGIEIWLTKEPTDTHLGDFTREISETLGEESLTCLVAADRYHHLDNDIIPQLKSDRIIITDRYILSSLILQRMDNVDVDFILAANEHILLPDVQIVVTADSSIIETRLSERRQLTRFEFGKRSSEELHFLQEGVKILAQFGVPIIEIENSGDLSKNVSIIAKYIIEVMR